MFVDARSLDREREEADICVVGGGAAGIAFAREFAGGSTRICVLESGGLEPEEQSQLLAEGESVGLLYPPLVAARMRFFGGNTNHWGGYCRPMRALDFEAREGLPYSGWPFGLDELRPFYERAVPVVGLPSGDFDVDHWIKEGGASPLPLDGKLPPMAAQIVRPKSAGRFGLAYRAELERAANVVVHLHANLLEFETDEYGGSVTRARVGCLDGRRFEVKANYFVLAAGGIENARLLLASNSRFSFGLGNQRDLVGRFFMEHPRATVAKLIPASPGMSLAFYQTHRAGPSAITGAMGLPVSLLRTERLPDVQVRLRPVFSSDWQEASSSDGASSAKLLARGLRDGKLAGELDTHLGNVIGDFDELASLGWQWLRNFGTPPLDHAEVIVRAEQLPNPDSRVTLCATRDALGMPHARLDWRLYPSEVAPVRRALDLFAQEIGRTGQGRVRSLLDNDEAWFGHLRPGWHHMGTTRMSDDPARGVVDRDCRVHGLSNLWVAGSSVFPTAGSGTPTLTLVALALRLADHLKERMAA